MQNCDYGSISNGFGGMDAEEPFRCDDDNDRHALQDNGDAADGVAIKIPPISSNCMHGACMQSQCKIKNC